MNPMQKLLNDKTVALHQLSRLSAILNMRGMRIDDGHDLSPFLGLAK